MDIMEDDMEDEPTLPVKNDDEFKPFIRRLPEFKFWYLLFLFSLCYNNIDTR